MRMPYTSRFEDKAGNVQIMLRPPLREAAMSFFQAHGKPLVFDTPARLIEIDGEQCVWFRLTSQSVRQSGSQDRQSVSQALKIVGQSVSQAVKIVSQDCRGSGLCTWLPGALRSASVPRIMAMLGTLAGSTNVNCHRISAMGLPPRTLSRSAWMAAPGLAPMAKLVQASMASRCCITRRMTSPRPIRGPALVDITQVRCWSYRWMVFSSIE